MDFQSFSSAPDTLKDLNIHDMDLEVNLDPLDDVTPYKNTIRHFREIISNAGVPVQHSWDQLNLVTKSADQESMDINALRITGLIANIMKTIEYISVLPVLKLNNYRLLRFYFKPDEAHIMKDILTKRSRIKLVPLESRHDLMRAFGNTRSTVCVPDLEGQINTDMARMFVLLLGNAKLLKCCKRLTEGRRKPWVQNLLNELAAFKDVVSERANITAESERMKIQELQMAYIVYNEKQVIIAALEEELNKKKIKNDRATALVNEELALLRSKINSIVEKTTGLVNARVTVSEQNQILATDKSETIKIGLAETSRLQITQYQALLEHHLAEEKLSRASTYKIESQLVQWIAKYDGDITQRQDELEELTESCDSFEAELAALRVKFDEQEEVFNLYREEWEENVEELHYRARKRAAVKIANYWLKYRARKLEEKKRNRKMKRDQKKKEKK